MSDENIKVAVRIRPLNQRETDMQSVSCVDLLDEHSVEIPNPSNGKNETFTFDHAYGMESTQAQVYEDLGRPMLEKALDGFNCTIFAYGQTGAGKTYSMAGYGTDYGIIPRLNLELYERIEEVSSSSHRVLITVSYSEIYNEEIRDLLNPSDEELRIRQHPTQGIYVEGLAELVVKSYEEIERLMTQGNKVRTVAATKMNQTSSRSHSIFTIKIAQKIQKGNTEKQLTSKINLVDLAGSERAATTGAEGDTLKEGASINKSLSVLGNVINALADSKKKNKHVPYRDSKLTRILQESLGGNAVTVMIAALSPATVNHPETYSTLIYANRAKNIKNQSRKNEDESTRMIRELKEEIERLRGQVSQPGAQGASSEIAAKLRELEDANAEQSWEEKERMSRQFEEDRQKNLASKGLFDVLQQNLEKGNQELMEKIAKVKGEQEQLDREIAEKKRAAQEMKEQFEEEVRQYKEAEKAATLQSSEKQERLAKIEKLKKNVMVISDVLKELKHKKHQLHQEDVRAQQALMMSEGSEIRKLIEQREKEKVTQENEAYLAEMRAKMAEELENERRRIVRDHASKVDADEFESLMGQFLDMERQLLEERASRLMLARQVRVLEEERDSLEDKLFRTKRTMNQERDQFRESFERFRNDYNAKYSSDMSEVIRRALEAEKARDALAARVQQLEAAVAGLQ